MSSQLLLCASCRLQLGREISIVDTSYFVFSKPAYLLSEIALQQCTRSATEKRTMRSGTYDIQWIACKCGAALGFLYTAVHDPSFSYKTGKAVMVQERLCLASPLVNPGGGTAPFSGFSGVTETVAVALPSPATMNEGTPSGVETYTIPPTHLPATIPQSTIHDKKEPIPVINTCPTSASCGEKSSAQGWGGEFEEIDDDFIIIRKEDCVEANTEDNDFGVLSFD